MLDILLIDALGQLYYPATAAAARCVFADRATHPFPPTFIMPPEWGLELEVMAQELGFAVRSAADIHQRFHGIIQMLGAVHGE